LIDWWQTGFVAEDEHWWGRFQDYGKDHPGFENRHHHRSDFLDGSMATF